MIPQLVINDVVTWVGETIHPVPGPAVCSKVRDLLKIRSPRAGLPTNLELRSTGDAALATALSTGEGMVAMLSILDLAASSNLPQPLAEASAPASALLHDSAFLVSPHQWNSQTPRSWVRKDAQSGTERVQLGDDANRRQFQVALLENCSFFADLVLRRVRAGGGRSGGLLERDSFGNKVNVVRVSPTPPRSKGNVVQRQRREETALPPETPSSLLPTLWVEVGCRHLQTVVSEKGRP